MTISICQCCLNHSIDNCARNLHHLHPNSQLNARLRGCFFIPSPCCSAASASQLAVLTNEQPFDCFWRTLWRTSIPFCQYFFSEVLNGKNCGWVKTSRNVTIWELHSMRSISSCFTSHFKSLYFMLNACSKPIGSRINKSTVPTSRFWGSSPNPNIACQDFGSWIEEIMIVMCFDIHTHTYIRIHIRDKDIYQREREGRERELVRCYGKIDGVCVCTYSFRNVYNDDHGLT